MNKDQVKGSAKTAAGKLQKNAGKAVGSTEHQVKGAAREIAGKTQKAYGDIKDDARKSRAH
ncbi:MAG: CsbD family protein [Steroidobacteraceae bacterium]